MAITYKLSRVIRLLIICFTLCKSSAAQMNYGEDEPCDFHTYKGKCLAASKCLELPVIMNELNLKSTDVGHCGFAAIEEIICCPTRQATARNAKELPNKLGDLLKPFEFRPSPQNETTARSTQPIPADHWFSNNFKEISKDYSVGNNNRNSAPAQWQSGDNTQRINGIFNGRPLPNVSINDEKARRINTSFNGNPVPSGIPIEDNAQRINAIFNGNAVPNGNINAMFNSQESRTRINGIFNGSPVPNGSIDDEKAQRINALFNGNPVPSGIPVEDNTQRINAIFNGNAVPSGNILNDNARRISGNDPNNDNAQRFNAIFNAQGSQTRINGIFNGSPVPNGSIEDEKARRINAIFNGNPVPSGIPIEDNTQKIKAIFNENTLPNGNILNDNARRINSIFGGNDNRQDNIQRNNAISNRNPGSNLNLNANDLLAKNANVDHTQRIHAIFNPDSHVENIQSSNPQNPTQFGGHNEDPFHNFLRQPGNRRFSNHRFQAKDEVFNAPVQQPPLPLQNQFQPQFGSLVRQLVQSGH